MAEEITNDTASIEAAGRGKNGLLGVRSINYFLKRPSLMPFVLGSDLVDRLAPMDLKETPMWFVDLVADRVANTGKHVDDLTVREVREIIEECTIATNKAAKRKLYWWKYT